MYTLFSFTFFLVPAICLPAPIFPAIGSPCDDWRVEVCENVLSYNTGAYPDAPGCTDNCYRVYYHFYLVHNGTENMQTNRDGYPFSFTSLTVTGTLAVTQGVGSSAGMSLSKVNLPESVACSPSYPGLNNSGIPNSPLLGYDPQTHQFAYQVSAAST